MYNDPGNSPGGHLELQAMDFKQSDNCFKLPVLIQRETGADSYASSASADNPLTSELKQGSIILIKDVIMSVSVFQKHHHTIPAHCLDGDTLPLHSLCIFHRLSPAV